ncbi:MAG: hypothetical protein ACXVFQ_18200 [Solirubrobacteraceae bacterium]
MSIRAVVTSHVVLPHVDRAGSRVASRPWDRGTRQRRRDRWTLARDRHEFPRVAHVADASEIVLLSAARTPEHRRAMTCAGDRAGWGAGPSITGRDDERW